MCGSFVFSASPLGIEPVRFDKPTSGECRLGRRAALWHGGPSRNLGCLRRIRRSRMQRELRTIPVAIDSPPSWWRFCFGFPIGSIRLLGSKVGLRSSSVKTNAASARDVETTTGCPVNIRWDAVPPYGTAVPRMAMAGCEGFADRRGNAIGEQSPWGLILIPLIAAAHLPPVPKNFQFG